MHKNCIVAFANSKNNYVNALARLHESLRDNFDGDFLGFIGEGSVGAPKHSDNPYAFKLFAINIARSLGYKNVLYLDSSCFAIKNVQPCFDEIERSGFLFQDAGGHLASEWINDYSLKYFGITREEAREIRLIGNAGMLGLSFENEMANLFFRNWWKSMKHGCFVGKWNNDEKTESLSEECKGHRHDMVSGIIIHKMGLSHLAKPCDEWLQYAGVFYETLNDTIIFKAQGL